MKPTQSIVRINIFLEVDLHGRLKADAALSGRTLQELVETTISRQLEQDKRYIREVIAGKTISFPAAVPHKTAAAKRLNIALSIENQKLLKVIAAITDRSINSYLVDCLQGNKRPVPAGVRP